MGARCGFSFKSEINELNTGCDTRPPVGFHLSREFGTWLRHSELSEVGLAHPGGRGFLCAGGVGPRVAAAAGSKGATLALHVSWQIVFGGQRYESTVYLVVPGCLFVAVSNQWMKLSINLASLGNGFHFPCR